MNSAKKKGRRSFRNKERNQEESFEIIDFAFALVDFPVVTFLTVLLFVLRKEFVAKCPPLLAHFTVANS